VQPLGVDVTAAGAAKWKWKGGHGDGDGETLKELLRRMQQEPQRHEVELQPWQQQRANVYPGLPVIETTDDKGDTSVFKDRAVYRDEEERGEVEDDDDVASSVIGSVEDDPEGGRPGLSRAHYIVGTNMPWPCGMTNFHFSLCVGCICFLIFWVLLLLRIYLPSEYFE